MHRLRAFLLLAPVALHAQETAEARDTTARPVGHRHIGLTYHDYGITIGNAARTNGVRINLQDAGLERVNGLNVTIWTPREPLSGTVNGLAVGIAGPGAGELNGIAIGLGGVVAERRARWLTVGGLGVVSNDRLEGVAVGGLGTVANGQIRGIAVGGLGAVSNGDVRGVVVGGLGAVANRDLTGIAIDRKSVV